eukprot:1158709-Pelagomonas_calceolata.AAC.3
MGHIHTHIPSTHAVCRQPQCAHVPSSEAVQVFKPEKAEASLEHDATCTCIACASHTCPGAASLRVGQDISIWRGGQEKQTFWTSRFKPQETYLEA